MYYSVLGDSISTFYGYVPENYAVFYTLEAAMYNGLTSIEDVWWHQVMNYLGAELLVDAAYSGGRVFGNEFPAANTYERIRALRTPQHEPDGILVYLGYNDYGYAVESGVTTFCKQTYSQVQLVLYINNSSRDYSRLVLVIGEIGWRFHWFAFYFSFSTTSIQHRCNPKLDIWHSRQKTKLNLSFCLNLKNSQG